MAQGRGRKPRHKKERPEFDQQIIDLARVTRVTKGGKQLSFRVCVVIGDRKGRVGYGVDKGKDVQIAVGKAVNQAKKSMIRVPIVDDTIPHQIEMKYKAGRVFMKPAPRGSGIIAGSSVRTLLEMAGVPNASAKILSKTGNNVVNLKAAFLALQSFKPEAVAKASAPKMTHKKNDKEVKEEKRDNEALDKKKSAPKKEDEKEVVKTEKK